MKSPVNNDDLVEYLQKQRIVETPAILEAFRAVDRGEFATPSLRQVVYQNRPVQLGDIHLSAPFIYAEALEAFNLHPGMSFLNIVSTGISGTPVAYPCVCVRVCMSVRATVYSTLCT